MSRTCTALILSKKGFGEGSLLLNTLDEERGKLKFLSFGGALERGSRRAALLSGNLIRGLVLPAEDSAERLTEALIEESYDNIRSELRPMGFFLLALEILDLSLPENLPLGTFPQLLQALHLFNESMDEKFILFYLMGHLQAEGFLDIPEKEKLSPPVQRFFADAQREEPSFLGGKHISPTRKREVVYFFAHALKKAVNRNLKSLELLRFE